LWKKDIDKNKKKGVTVEKTTYLKRATTILFLGVVKERYRQQLESIFFRA